MLDILSCCLIVRSIFLPFFELNRFEPLVSVVISNKFLDFLGAKASCPVPIDLMVGTIEIYKQRLIPLLSLGDNPHIIHGLEGLEFLWTNTGYLSQVPCLFEPLKREEARVQPSF